jgi:hypothetical protein
VFSREATKAEALSAFLFVAARGAACDGVQAPALADEAQTRWRNVAAPTIFMRKEVQRVETLETYTSVLTVLSVALLLVAGGLGKKQIVWKPRIPAVRRRRLRP